MFLVGLVYEYTIFIHAILTFYILVYFYLGRYPKFKQTVVMPNYSDSPPVRIPLFIINTVSITTNSALVLNCYIEHKLSWSSFECSKIGISRVLHFYLYGVLNSIGIMITALGFMVIIYDVIPPGNFDFYILFVIGFECLIPAILKSISIL